MHCSNTSRYITEQKLKLKLQLHYVGMHIPDCFGKILTCAMRVSVVGSNSMSFPKNSSIAFPAYFGTTATVKTSLWFKRISQEAAESDRSSRELTKIIPATLKPANQSQMAFVSLSFFNSTQRKGWSFSLYRQTAAEPTNIASGRFMSCKIGLLAMQGISWHFPSDVMNTRAVQEQKWQKGGKNKNLCLIYWLCD